MGFIDVIKERARKNRKTIVLPETEDVRTIKAAAKILKQEIADLILVGNEEMINTKAYHYDYDLSKATIVDPLHFDKLDSYVETLVDLRKKKGMTEEKAKELLTTDYLHFGVMMVKMGDADGMVAGACHATADVLRPSLQILKTAPGTELVSGMFVMVVPDCDYGANGTFIFSDAGLNQNPTAEELAMAIENLKKNIPESRINNGYWMKALSSWDEYGINYDKEYEDAVNSVTAEDIKKLLQKILKQKNCIEFKSMPAAK